MEANKITIKIKHLTDKVYDVEIEEGASILDLKATLSQITGVPATDQKLIFKGNPFFSPLFIQLPQEKCSRTLISSRLLALKMEALCIWSKLRLLPVQLEQLLNLLLLKAPPELLVVISVSPLICQAVAVAF